MRYLTTLALALATAAHAADPALFTMTDAQLKAYTTHEATTLIASKKARTEQITKYRQKCSRDDLQSCIAGLTLGSRAAGGDKAYFDASGVVRTRNGGKSPKWLESLGNEYTDATAALTAEMKAMKQAADAAR